MSSSKKGDGDAGGKLNIWDSADADEISDDVALLTAIELVKGNLDRCLSLCAIADSEECKKHKDVILNLPGQFSLKVDPQHPRSYAFTDETGISFNQVLVDKSTNYFWRKYEENPNFFGEDKIFISYVALIQQSLEHELAHLKNHVEKMKDPGIEKYTPTKLQTGGENLKGEAGYAIQREIRTSSFPGQKITVLEVGPKCCTGPRKGYFDPDRLNLRLGEIIEDKMGFKMKTGSSDPLSLSDIVQHMAYPNSDSCKGKRGTDDGPGSGPPTDQDRLRKRKRDNDDDDDDDEPPSSQRPLSESRWIRDVKAIVPKVSQRALFKGIVDASMQYETSLDGTDPSSEDIYPGDDAYNLTLQQDCEVNVVFCNEDRQVQTSFAPSDDIYAMLSVKNTLQEKVFFEIGYGTFGRSGMQLLIVGKQLGYVACGYGLSSRVVVLIEPGKQYTFVRQFTHGGKKSPLCYYQTPPPGSYKAEVCITNGLLYPNKFGFTVNTV